MSASKCFLSWILNIWLTLGVRLDMVEFRYQVEVNHGPSSLTYVIAELLRGEIAQRPGPEIRNCNGQSYVLFHDSLWSR